MKYQDKNSVGFESMRSIGTVNLISIRLKNPFYLIYERFNDYNETLGIKFLVIAEFCHIRTIIEFVTILEWTVSYS
jgi:hypothetical protein